MELTPTVIMYTRHGCHLCEDAWALLQQERRKYRFQLTSVDVDSAPELAAQYGEEVPVIAVNDKVRFRGRINRVLLTRLLRAEARPGSPPGPE
jgi:glutaredoxin